MNTVRVGGVPEHFNHPWKIAQEKGFFSRRGISIEWTDHKNGTGAMITALRNNELDVIVALTEGLVLESVKGKDIQLFGTYVQSPLRWAVITGQTTPFQSVADLKGESFAISRFTSGSHLMAGVLASNMGWDVSSDVKFKPVGPLKDLIWSVNSDAAAFLWEYFMTKPYADSGEVRFIGEISTPWGCFMMASRKEYLESHRDVLALVLQGLQEGIQDFYSDPATVSTIATNFGITEADTQQWYDSVKIVGTASASRADLTRAVSALQKIHVLPVDNVDLEVIVDTRICSFTA
jgi:ABC-type nitrate/sulfonate/bicarbonate transport system substrate-binding protein